ncbi:DUF2092 domain-containing protein [Pengzhenrongella sp.]|jgi:outer membrane lipoprotein-sorting protein|uniref:LolA family protein n=1 Tax=Pengzhenrongella sp. TaxID=2888820 RepID=UPI002F94AC8B
MNRTWSRWVPAAVVPAVVAVYALAGPAFAGAVDLPTKTPEQVLQLIGQSHVQALSGTLEQTSHLGLPELPTGGPAGSGGAAAALDLLTRTHTARVYLDGPTNARVQVLDSLAERDVVRHGTDVWFFSSQTDTATHLTLPAGAAEKAGPTTPPDMPTPAQLAHHFVTAIGPSTRVSVEKDVTVAGRAAYQLVLAPRAAGTLIGSVSIAVDSRSGLPLRVTVSATGQAKPAFQLGFTALSLTTPPAARFEFTPPVGATLTQQALPQGLAKHEPAGRAAADDSAAKAAAAHAHDGSPGPEPTVLGTGWDAVVVLPAGALPPEVTTSPIFSQVTRAFAGGRALHTALVNVFVTADGRVLAGSVPLERLRAAAAGQ